MMMETASMNDRLRTTTWRGACPDVHVLLPKAQVWKGTVAYMRPCPSRHTQPVWP